MSFKVSLNKIAVTTKTLGEIPTIFYQVPLCRPSAGYCTALFPETLPGSFYSQILSEIIYLGSHAKWENLAVHGLLLQNLYYFHLEANQNLLILYDAKILTVHF